MKFLILLSLLFTQAFAYEYQVKEDDNLSTILNSMAEFEKGNLGKEIDSHSERFNSSIIADLPKEAFTL